MRRLDTAKEVKELVNREVEARVFVFGSVVRGDYCIGLSDIDISSSIRGFQEHREKAEKIRCSLREILRFPNRIPPLTTLTTGVFLRFKGAEYIKI